jgi:hypothetical protein
MIFTKGLISAKEIPMILVRNIFEVKFGKMKDAMTLWKDADSLLKAVGHKPQRIATDLSGKFYTLVVENVYDSLTEYDKANAEMGKRDEWNKWYQKFVPLVESGRRELYTIVN